MNLRYYITKLFFILFAFCCCQLNAQQAIQQKVNEKFATTINAPTYAPLVEVESNNLKNSIPEATLSQKQFFQIHPQQFQSIKEDKAEQLIISLPIEGEQVAFQLIKAEIFSDDFQVVAASGTSLSQDMGVHYWGTAAGDANSLATFSFMGDELVGGIYISGKQYTLGKLKNSDTHILYNNADLKNDVEFTCQELLPPGATQGGVSINPQPLNSTAANCVSIHMEVDYSLYQAANSDASLASNYVTGVFAQVAALYANESIVVQMSYIQVWDTPSPYGNGTELDDLVAQSYGKTHGDLVHLVHTNSAGGLAYLNVICNSFVNTGVSGLLGTYQNVPTYSWDVEVITHEIGHNLGSPHTHACAWNGNNTAIDGCGPAAGYDEGCDAALPTSGTVMSYCHLVSGVGIDFNLGFGQQPGDLVRNRVNSASCLTECTTCELGQPGVSCDDNDPCTINDTVTADCECVGQFLDSDNDGVCNLQDQCPNINDALIGIPCNDSDPCTVDDAFNQNCECVGIFADADGDGVCDANDICEFGDDNLDTDGDGTPDACDFSDGSMDTDQDGVPDDEDVCPNFDDNLIGTPCDDGDICTSNDIYTQDCECTGALIDADGNGICDADESEAAYSLTFSVAEVDCQNQTISVDFAVQAADANSSFDIADQNYRISFDRKIANPTIVEELGLSGIYPLPNNEFALFSPHSMLGSVDTVISYNIALQTTTGFPISTTPIPVGRIGFDIVDDSGCFDLKWHTPAIYPSTVVIEENDGSLIPITTGNYSNITICLDEYCPSCDVGATCDDGDECTTNDTITENCECEGTFADADEDGVCDAEDICEDFDDALIGTSCDDNNDCTVQDIYTENCECEGTYLDSDDDGVCDAEDICEDFDDALIGTACDDNNPCTVQDIYTENCECEGTFADADEDGVCDAEDACPDFNDALIGTSCDDNNDCTVEDMYTENCECEGTFADADEDGVCDAEDICADFDDALIGTACDDNNDCTVQDIYTENCECEGTFADADEDGVCDAEDACPDFNDALIGTSCDDNNDCTVEDMYTENCECEGTFADADEDGVCDAEDICEDFDDALIGTPCDDNNACTVQDIYVDCECMGTYVDSDEDGICDEEDACPILNNSLIGTPCDDNDACTTGDIYTPDCECAGTFADTDGDGVCDEEDICEFGDDNLDADGDGIPDACDILDGIDSDGDGVPDSEDICPGGDDNIDTDGNGTPDACEDCPTFNFIDYPAVTYGNNQDRGIVTTSADGTTIELNDNAWKAIVVDYEVTPYTVVEFDFKSTQIGEIHGVGFDNNTSISSGRTFKLYGTQNWGNLTFNDYTGSGEYEHYVIPVGEFYTGDFDYFFFVADHDSQPQDGNSFFANLKIYEDANQDGLCDDADDCADTDQDGVCDDDDVCEGGDDTLDMDEDGTPDYCDICPEDAENACDSAPDYCESSGSNTNYEYIDRVVFGNIDNTSGNNGGYADFTNQVANVGLGDVVPLGLTPGFADVSYNEGWRIWIDFNKDGDFDDDGERVFSDNSAGSLADNIEIPNDATLGLTGMRVSMRWNRYAGACSDFTYGEVEDYTVNITTESQNYSPLDLRGEEYLVESPAMRVFPNPATDLITVNFQNIREGGSVAIYSTSGQLIGTHTITSEHLQLPVHKLPAGVYILHLNFGDGNYATERFVKLSE